MNIQNIGMSYSVVGETRPSFKETQTSPGSPMPGNAGSGTEEIGARTDISQTARTLSHLVGTLSHTGKVIAKMKDQLLEIRRTLPPFQPGDAERVRILRGYIGLRQLIDELTVPPPAKSEQFKEGLQLPVLNDKATDQELDAAIKILDRTEQTIREKQGSLGTLIGL
jgi:hypothetical protein